MSWILEHWEAMLKGVTAVVSLIIVFLKIFFRDKPVNPVAPSYPGQRVRNESFQVKLEKEAESLSALLQAKHKDALSVNFLINKRKKRPLSNFDAFLTYLDEEICPFVDSLEGDSSCFEHLVSTGCGSLTADSREYRRLGHIFKIDYPNIFSDADMMGSVVKEQILERRPGMKKLFDLWNENGDLSKFSLAPLGIVIAISNIKARTDIQLDIGDWI